MADSLLSFGFVSLYLFSLEEYRRGGEWLFNGLAEINVSRGEKTSSLILTVNKESSFFSAKTFN